MKVSHIKHYLATEEEEVVWLGDEHCLQVALRSLGAYRFFNALPLGLGNGHKGRQQLWREDLDFISWHTDLGAFQGCRDRQLCLKAG